MRYCPRFSPTKPSISLLELTKNPLVLSPLPFFRYTLDKYGREALEKTIADAVSMLK